METRSDYALWPEPIDPAGHTKQTMPEGWVWCDACGHSYPPRSVHAMAVVQERGSSR